MRFGKIPLISVVAKLALTVCPEIALGNDGEDHGVTDLTRNWREGTAAVAPGAAGAVVMEFGEAQPVLTCKVLQLCTIRLKPGETLTEAPTLGDAVRWSAAVRAGGNGRENVIYVIVKPASTAVATSLFLTTDQRAYHVALRLSDTDYTPLLFFTYPEDREAENRARVAAMQVERAEAERSSLKVEGQRIPAEELDFAYRITGSAPFKPTRIFNDGQRTYIDLPESYQGDLPVFLAIGGTGQEVVNYRFAGLRLIVDAVVEGGKLMLGTGGRSTVTIRRGR